MATYGPPIWELLAAAALLFAVLLVGYYALTRLRTRRRQLSLELENARDLVEDRAHNQLRLARAEAALLNRDGLEIGRAGDLLEEAETALARRNFDTALAYARSAHESLVKVRRDGAGSTGKRDRSPGPGTGPEAAPWAAPASERPRDGPTGGASGIEPGAADPAPDAPRPTLPRNKAESRFQLSLLGEEVDRAATATPTDPAVPEATEIRTRAEAASERGDYTEALRLALRGRRRLGSRVESLPPPKAPAAAAAPAAHASPAPPAPPAEEGGLACRSCGEPLRGNDRFCRFCGTLRGPPRCGGCGAELDTGDRFCAACGRSVTAPAP